MRLQPFLSLSLLALAAASPAALAEAYSQALAADANAHVDISNVAGDVTISGWDRLEVAVEGRLEPGVERVRFEGDRRSLVIEVETGHRRNGAAFLTIHVPRAAALEVSTVSAPISVQEVIGELELASVSGDLRVGDGAGSVRAETVSGTTEIGACRGFARVSSVSGPITVRDARKLLEASTVSGSLDVSGAALESVELESVSGSIRFAGELAARGRLSAQSHSGNLTLELPATLDADISAESFSGTIRNAFGPPATRNQHGPGSELEFRLGAGGARISAEVFSGDLTLKPLK